MTLEELKNQPKYVRVLASTLIYGPTHKAMIGGEYEVYSEVYSEDYLDHTVDLWNKDKSYYFRFGRSDVQFLTPVEFNGKRIGIGDSVLWGGKWHIVYDCIWYCGAWKLCVSGDEQLKDAWCVRPGEITDHRPLQIANPAKLKWQQEMERLKEEGRKNGWLT